MKKQKINELEKSMRTAFRSDAEFTQPDKWREQVMLDVRRSWYAKPGMQLEEQAILPLRLMWRFSAGLVIAAILICITLYLSFPVKSTTTELADDIPFDSFDKYILTVAQL
jgi:hypothetical protein